MANLGNTTIFGELKVSLDISSKNKSFWYDSVNQVLRLTHTSTIGGTNLDNGALVIKSSNGANTLALNGNEIIADGISSTLIIGTVNGSNGISFRPQNTQILLVSSYGISVTGAIATTGALTANGGISTTNISVSSTLNSSGNTNVGGVLTVTGSSSLKGGLSTTSITTSGNLTVGGSLIVNGTTTTVNSTVITIDNPIIMLGGDVAPTVDDSKDRGVEFRWHNGTTAKVGFFGFDDSTGKFTFIPDATNTSEVFSGTAGTIVANLEGNVTGDLTGNASTATKLSTARTIGIMTGDVTSVGSSFDGSANNSNVATIGANKVTNAKLAQMPTMTIKGNDTIGSADPQDLTVSEIQTMINGDVSSNLMTSSKTIVGAINELNTNKPLIDTGAIMGVKFIDNGAGFNAERYGLAKGKTFSYSTNGNTTTINSDFDTMPIYKYMRRGIFDNNSVLVYDQDDVGYDDTLTTLTSKGQLAPHTHWVGVYIPKFYFRINVTFTPTYVMDIAVSDKPFDGSLVHPVFTQHDNSGVLVERDYIVFSAYEGVLVNKSTGAYLFTNRADITTRIASDFQVGTPSGLTAYANYAMTFVNKANAQAPATNRTLSNFRTMAQNRSTGNSSGRAITQQQFFAWTAINTLFMVEFASTDWQTILSAGVTNLSSGTHNESVSTGHTSALKGKSGYVTGIVRGN